MTITTYGYAGEVDEVAYAQSNVLSGVRYGVSGLTDFRPTVGVGDRAVSIAAGEAMGGGVRVVNDTPVTLNHSSVGAGSRWDLIVLRRDWSTGTATLVIIEGSSSKALPSRDTDIGDVDDQPIALVRVTSGSSVVAEIVDLRVVQGDGGLYAFDDLTLSFMTRVGTVLRIRDTVWTRTVDGSGNGVWKAAGSVLPSRFVARFRRSDGQLAINPGALNTLMKWQSINDNPDGWATSAGPNGATVTIPAGQYRVTAAIKTACDVQNYLQMFLAWSGSVVALGDSAWEFQTPAGFSEPAIAHDVFVPTSATLSVVIKSNAAATMRIDGTLKIFRTA